MSESGAPLAPPQQEVKQRITRSSIGLANTSATDSLKQEDSSVLDRSISPANSRSTRSRTSTPTHDASDTSYEIPAPGPAMKRKMGVGPAPAPPRRNLRSNKLNSDEDSDTFCWICRKDGMVTSCQLCPRVFHLKCLGMTSSPGEDWICVECEKVMRSECEDTRPQMLSQLTIDQLILCLQYALERMKVPNSEVFQVPVDPAMEPEYHNIIVHPMDMSQLDKNIKKKTYGSTEAFLADVRWILHNSIIYNGTHNKYTMTAKSIVKVCRNQMTEIETCPDCYLQSCTQENNWFATPCRLPHPLVWAKLKGYPFWPAKALKEVDGQVDCRFFGAHDKAWVSASQVFMLSDEPPAPVKHKKGSGFDEAMVELDTYIKLFKAKHGVFTYSEVREPYRADYGQVTSKTDSQPSTEATKCETTTTESNGATDMKVKSDAGVKQEVMTDEKTNKRPVEDGQKVTNGELTEPVKPGIFTMSESAMEGVTKLNIELFKNKNESEPTIDPLIEKVAQSLNSSVTNDSPAKPTKSETEPTTVDDSSKSTGEEPTKSPDDKPKNSSETETKPVEATSNSSNNSSVLPVTDKSSPAVMASATTTNSSATTSSDTSTTNTTNSTTATTNENEKSSSVTNRKTVPMETESAKDYSKKLEKTIENCKTKLGIDDSQLEAQGDESEEESDEESEESESESESRSEDEYDRRKRKRRSRYRSNKRARTEDYVDDVEELLSEKERLLSNQLLKLLNDGLQSTIKDVVKRTLSGQPPALPSPSASQATDLPLATSKQSPASTSQASATNYPAAETVNKSEQSPANSLQSKKTDSVLPNGQCSGDSGQPSDMTIRAQLLSNATTKDKVLGVSPVKQDNVNRVEPLADNQDNKALREELGFTTEPMNNEMIEKLQWKHKCEIEAIKHNAELATLEMRKAIETEKERALWRLRKQLEHKFKRIIEETKKKQWCAMCGKEAIFYCCWNTSYCDYPCQQKHWPMHLKTCAQIQKEEAEKKPSPASAGSSSSQQPPQNPPSNTHSPSSTTGAPPPYMPTSSASDLPSGYQLSGPVQYMPVHSSSSHVYQAQVLPYLPNHSLSHHRQVPVQTLPMQGRPSRASAPSSGSSAPIIYPVMQPPSASGPPPPQGFMVQQRHAYRLAPKY